MNSNDYIRLDEIRLDKKGGAGGNVENPVRPAADAATMWQAATQYGALAGIEAVLPPSHGMAGAAYPPPVLSLLGVAR